METHKNCGFPLQTCPGHPHQKSVSIGRASQLGFFSGHELIFAVVMTALADLALMGLQKMLARTRQRTDCREVCFFLGWWGGVSKKAVEPQTWVAFLLLSLLKPSCASSFAGFCANLQLACLTPLNLPTQATGTTAPSNRPEPQQSLPQAQQEGHRPTEKKQEP